MAINGSLIASLLLVEIAFACSGMPPQLNLQCPRKRYPTPLLNLVYPWPGEESEVKIQEELEAGRKILAQIALTCGADVTSLYSVLEYAHRQWLSEHFSNPTFQPASESLEQELVQQQRDLFACHYSDFEKLGNWFFVTDQSRSYCRPDIFAVCGSPIVVLLLGLLVYSLTNFSATTFPYLLGFVIVMALSSGGWSYILKRKLIKPATVADLLFVIPLTVFLIFSPIALLGQALGWVMLCYLAVRMTHGLIRARVGV